MGTWGAGVFQNDHALDLASVEASRLAGELERALTGPGAAFDDIEGPLLYVHLLAHLARGCEVTALDRATARAWKARYLHLFDSTLGQARPGYRTGRRRVIAREFDALIRRLPAEEPAPPKRRARR